MDTNMKKLAIADFYLHRKNVSTTQVFIGKVVGLH